MPNQDLEKALKHFTTTYPDAVEDFWSIRLRQKKAQKQRRVKDQGDRGAVTGGAQLDSMLELLAECARMVGIPHEAVFTKKKCEVPGYFRPTKEWDLLIVLDGKLIAAIEAKSHVGPSFGNNFNNRTEEALGSSLDFRTAQREQVFPVLYKPWLGYFFVLEDCESSQKAISNIREPHFKVLEAFRDASYVKRYMEFCRKLVLENCYDATALTLTKRPEPGIEEKFIAASKELDPSQFCKSFLCALIAAQS